MAQDSLTPTWDIVWIDSADDLAQIAAAAAGEEYIAVDTETVGWQTGNESLALVQIGIPSKKIAYIIDAIAVTTFEPIRDILVSTKPAKVAHNASFEDRQFGRVGIKMKGIRDTLPMSRSLRPDLPNHQLKTSCFFVLGKSLDKESQTSDWSVRPLTKKQLHYAALDVEILSDLYDALCAMESKLIVAPDVGVEKIMAELQIATREKFELIKDIAPRLSFIDQRVEKLKEALKHRLENGAPAYEGEYGNASIKAITQTEINTQKVKDVFPEIAPLVIAEKVERKRLVDTMKEFGIESARLQEVLDPKDTYYRLTLEIES